MPRLTAGRLDLTLAPATGGSIARFDYRCNGKSLAVLRGHEGIPDDSLNAASFPLVPYCNRIRDGRFSFRGRQVTLSRNLPGDPSPLHGQGWQNPWDVVRFEQGEAELRFVHSAGEWPWRYEARQHFSLDEGGLSVDLGCRNLDDEPMPCGLGQHPYFPCTARTRLDTSVVTAWTVDEQVLPVTRVPASGRYDLRNRTICGQDLDNGFGGWGGEARIDEPDLPFEIILSSPDASFFQLYSPVAGALFVAEPVTHANAALNEPEPLWRALGVQILEPGEEMWLRMRVEVVEK